MDSLWYSIVQWLHTLGLHVDGQATRAVGEAAARATATLDTPGLLALAAALGWASGLRLYAVVFITGPAGLAGWVALPEGLQVLQHPALLVASGFMLFVEFFADKIPGLDSVWDLLHTVIRIPAGAALAAGVFGADGTTMAAVASDKVTMAPLTSLSSFSMVSGSRRGQRGRVGMGQHTRACNDEHQVPGKYEMAKGHQRPPNRTAHEPGLGDGHGVHERAQWVEQDQPLQDAARIHLAST